MQVAVHRAQVGPPGDPTHHRIGSRYIDHETDQFTEGHRRSDNRRGLGITWDESVSHERRLRNRPRSVLFNGSGGEGKRRTEIKRGERRVVGEDLALIPARRQLAEDRCDRDPGARDARAAAHDLRM